MTTALKSAGARPAKGNGKLVARKGGRVKRARSTRRESKTVAEYKRWLTENAQDVAKWARANTKRLTGKEVL